MNVAVTGATGGIGKALVRLLIEQGHTVRAAVRTPQQSQKARGMGAEPVELDVTRPETFAAFVEGQDVVQHLAAWMGAPAGKADAINVHGAAGLAAAAAAAGVRRFVHASTMAVYGPVADGVVTEDRDLVTVGDAYGDSKVRGERAVRTALEGTCTELVVLRPTLVYGPETVSWTIAPVAVMRKGIPVLLGDGTHVVDVVYVDDVARAFAAAGTAQGVSDRAFNVTGQSVTTREFFGAYARMLGVPLRRVPAGLARFGGNIAARVTSVLPGDGFAPETMTTLLSHATFDGSAASDLLGYRASVSLDEGMSRTAAWLREHGHAPGPRSALIVGAATGLGKAVAAELAGRYVRVYGADLRAADDSDETDDRRRPVGHLIVDATSQASLEDAVTRIEETEGGLDLVVSTVGGLRPGSLESQPWEDVMAQLELNALAPIKAARAALPGMRARGRGRIINVSSTNALLVTPFMGAYSAAKAALEMFSDALRLELRPFGVDVVLVQPGAMRTGFARRAKAMLDKEARREGEPWGRFLDRLRESNLWGEANAAEPDQVARVVARVAFLRRPPARVAGTREVPFMRLFSAMPDTIKDSVFVKPLGLNRPRSDRRGPDVQGAGRGEPAS